MGRFKVDGIITDPVLRLEGIQTIKTLVGHAVSNGLHMDWNRFWKERDMRIITVSDTPLVRDFIIPVKEVRYIPIKGNYPEYGIFPEEGVNNE